MRVNLDMPREFARPQSVQVDALVIGGGVLGLWVLNDLHAAGYSAVLLERERLGEGQTGHSHGYIHQGHFYREKEALATGLRDAGLVWEEWLRHRDPIVYGDRSYFAFENPGLIPQRTAFWDRLNLRHEQVEIPEGIEVRAVLESPERCIDTEWLIRELARDVEDALTRVRRIAWFNRSAEGKGIERVAVEMPGLEMLDVEPKAVVLAAGVGNEDLIRLVSSGEAEHDLASSQVILKAHMLVVRGPSLPPFTGIFIRGDNSLFICSRRDHDDGVWLVSDQRSPEVSTVADWLRFDARWWLPSTITWLREVAPGFVGEPSQLLWGIYEAPKAEGTERVGRAPTIQRLAPNAWAIWPTKLTLAPSVSGQLIKEVAEVALAPAMWESPPAEWTSSRVPPDVAEERWRRIQLLDWHNFSRLYL